MENLNHYGKEYDSDISDLEEKIFGIGGKHIDPNGIPPEEHPDKRLFSYKINIAFRGLQNLNNTCYMNVIIQSLFMTHSFREQLIDLFFTEKEITNDNPHDFKWKIKNKGNTELQNSCLFQLGALFT
jgi:ubiquitin C-terminal hydrolase